MKTANISMILHRAYNIIDAIEMAYGGSDDIATLTQAKVEFAYEDEPYTLYISDSGSVTIHTYNDEIEVPF